MRTEEVLRANEARLRTEADIRRTLHRIGSARQRARHTVTAVGSAAEALEIIDLLTPHVLISDVVPAFRPAPPRA